MGLFLWDNKLKVSDDNKKRGWENILFRLLACSLYLLLRKKYDNTIAKRFLIAFKTSAS